MMYPSVHSRVSLAAGPCMQITARHAVRGSSSLTYDGSKDVERHVAAVFVRRTATGHLEAYIPSFFADAQRQMEQSFKKALDNTTTK